METNQIAKRSYVNLSGQLTWAVVKVSRRGLPVRPEGPVTTPSAPISQHPPQVTRQSCLVPQNSLHIPHTSNSNHLPALANFISAMAPHFHLHVCHSTRGPSVMWTTAVVSAAGALASSLSCCNLVSAQDQSHLSEMKVCSCYFPL